MGESAQPPGACVYVCVPHPGLTFEHGADPPDPQAALTCKLAEGEFHEEDRDPTEGDHDEVGDQEGSWWAGRGLAQGQLWGKPTVFHHPSLQLLAHYQLPCKAKLLQILLTDSLLCPLPWSFCPSTSTGTSLIMAIINIHTS